MSDLFSLDDLEVTTPTVNFNDSDVFSRLVFLLETMKLDLPNWLRYKIPFADQLSKPVVLWSPLLKAAYQKGSVYGEGNLDEVKQCLDKVLQPELKTFEERTKFYQYLAALADGLFDENEEVWLDQIDSGEQIQKFNSGFAPFDQATHGWYKSIVTVAGTPGSGKTSLLLSFMGCLAKYYPVWYFQTEIPKQLSKSRIALVKPSQPFKGCKVFHGNYSSEAILQLVEKDPDENRIIIYDSPEIKTSSVEPIAYFEKVYQDLVSIKMLSRMVVITSQTKQNIGWEDLGIYSLSDSAAKARYSDVILYIGRILDTVLIKTAKNRFGQLGQAMTKYNYETLKIQDDNLDDMFGDN